MDMLARIKEYREMRKWLCFSHRHIVSFYAKEIGEIEARYQVAQDRDEKHLTLDNRHQMTINVLSDEMYGANYIWDYTGSQSGINWVMWHRMREEIPTHIFVSWKNYE